MNIWGKRQNFFLIALPIFAFLFWLIDLGNVEAIRQGTEGFYLQVSKEIYQFKSWLVPMYLGAPHWSKPPLHFWAPQPFFLLTGISSLFLSRLSILIFSLLITWFIDRWSVKHLKTKPLVAFFMLLASVGFLKYSRIYMMEMPLCLLTAYASLRYFQYAEDQTRRNFLILVFLTAAANLVKGPVSFVMNFGGVGLFLIYEFFKTKNFPLKQIILWGVSSVLLGSVWYIICYINYGDEFINYFFLRENLGKFQSKSYPLSSVINGLLILSLPWTLLVPALFKISFLKKFFEDKLNRFLIFHFLFLFILWMIPSQRSHHYAMPSQPFFILILLSAFTHYREELRTNWIKPVFAFMASFFIFFSLVTLSTLAFKEIRGSELSVLRVMGAVFFLAASALIIWKNKPHLFPTSLASFFSLGFIWILFAPIFYLPTIPNNVIERVKGEQVSVIYNKPYFLSELLGKDVRVLNEVLIQVDRTTPQKYYIMKEYDYRRYGLDDFLSIKDAWPIWKRNNGLKEMGQAYSQTSLNSLKENMVLLVPKVD